MAPSSYKISSVTVIPLLISSIFENCTQVHKNLGSGIIIHNFMSLHFIFFNKVKSSTDFVSEKVAKGNCPLPCNSKREGIKINFIFMLKKIKKTLIALALSLTLFCGIAYAVVEQGDCSPNVTFWGTRCCTYLIEDPVYVDQLVQKCCDYRVFINFGCEETTILP